MGLLDYIKTQLLEIIQWQDDSRDTVSWRFPVYIIPFIFSESLAKISSMDPTPFTG